jgi:hypothetical protein
MLSHFWNYRFNTPDVCGESPQTTGESPVLPALLHISNRYTLEERPGQWIFVLGTQHAKLKLRKRNFAGE